MVSRHHLIAWSKIPDRAQVVAIADPSTANAGTRASEFDVPAIYADAQAMLKAERLDAIDIAAPREVHAAMVRLGAEHNLAVLCQKPLAPDLEQAAELVAEMAGRIRLMVHENWRFRPYYRDAAACIGEGLVGTIQQCRITLVTSGLLADAQGNRPALVRQPFMRELKRMIVAEVLIHHLDTLRVLCGDLQVTAATLGRSAPDMAGEDKALIQMQAANGAAVSLLGDMAAPSQPAVQVDRMELFGDRGSLSLEGDTLNCTGAVQREKTYDLAACYQAAYDGVIAHFIDALQTGAPFETSPDDNLKTLQLVEDAYRLAAWPH